MPNVYECKCNKCHRVYECLLTEHQRRYFCKGPFKDNADWIKKVDTQLMLNRKRWFKCV